MRVQLSFEPMLETYELCGDEIVSTALFRKKCIRINDINTWQEIYIGGGVPFICIHFADGRKVDFDDEHEELFGILRQVAADKKMPFASA